MSGPPYPPPPAPGSNAIGSFAIGVSPIGLISDFDWRATVISQFANSTILLSLLETFDDCLDQTANFEALFDNIWNIETAVGYGLDVWGRIVGVNRVLHVVNPGRYFGYQEQGGETDPFNVSPFYTGADVTTNFALSDDAFRTLIYAKALANITDGSIPAINKILMTLFPNRGNAYVVDNLDMTMVYKFDFALSAVELAIIEQSGALPKPTGVSATISQVI